MLNLLLHVQMVPLLHRHPNVRALSLKGVPAGASLFRQNLPALTRLAINTKTKADLSADFCTNKQCVLAMLTSNMGAHAHAQLILKKQCPSVDLLPRSSASWLANAITRQTTCMQIEE